MNTKLPDSVSPGKPPRLARLRSRFGPPLLAVLGVIAVFWKLALTKQYTFLASPDLASQVMPWLQVQVFALRHWSFALWNPYEWFGVPFLAQVVTNGASPFVFLLSLAPLHHGQIQIFYVHLWLVAIHCIAALFAYYLFKDLGCRPGPAVIGALFYATAGYCGNTEWPQVLSAGIWAPLVFLFLLRSLRGRTPIRSAAWAGVALGFSWLSGHHEPATMLTLAVAGVGLVTVFAGKHIRVGLLRLGVLFAVMGLVSAVQVLPALEYGKYAKRWTATGALTWKEKVEFPEHQDSGLRPSDLLHIVMPGGNGLRTDPFVGTVGLSLAALAVWGAFQRREVRLFAVLAVCAVFYAMSRNDALYGVLYALIPAVEKSRAPVMALSIFHFSIAVLVALGADLLTNHPETARRPLIKALLWFGGINFALLLLVAYLRPTVNSVIADGDPRPAVIGLIAVLLAGLYYAGSRGHVARTGVLLILGLLLIIEQSNEVGWGWAHVRDPRDSGRMAIVNALRDTQDLADWLRTRPNPKRLEIEGKDVTFSFGDWYRMDAAHAFGASMLTSTSELGGWWVDRIGRMYGLNYVVSRAPTRPGLQEQFTGKTGLKIWYNPEAFPRAWTVHQTVVAPNEWNGADMVNHWPFDLRTTALTVRSQPRLDTCAGPDKVGWIDERPSSVRVGVEMACQGMLVVSDNWYPGWRAEIDGQAADIWKVNTVIRGVVVGRGRHTVSMLYQPFSVYFGLFCTLLGLAAAIALQRRREEDGPGWGML